MFSHLKQHEIRNFDHHPGFTNPSKFSCNHFRMLFEIQEWTIKLWLLCDIYKYTKFNITYVYHLYITISLVQSMQELQSQWNYPWPISKNQVHTIEHRTRHVLICSDKRNKFHAGDTSFANYMTARLEILILVMQIGKTWQKKSGA